MSVQVKQSQAGFSLIELIVAMVITLIVSGAIFGLMAGGQSAFRREPELTDRQQQVRIAMDLMSRDAATAGMGMPEFMQVFSEDKDGSDLASCTECPLGPNGVKTDEFELIGNTSDDMEPLCGYSGGASHVRSTRNNTGVPGGLQIIFMLNPPGWNLRNILATHNNQGGPGTCDAKVDHDDFSFKSGGDSSGFNTAGGLCDATEVLGTSGLAPCNPTFIGGAQFYSYRIRNGADGVPNLERFASGSVNEFTGNVLANGLNWHVVARGIEDLQVKYSTTAASAACGGCPPDNVNWVDGAPHVDSDPATAATGVAYGTIVSRVAITLASRTSAPALQGMSAAATGPLAVRGSMTSVIAIRSALEQARNQEAVTLNPKPSPYWR